MRILLSAVYYVLQVMEFAIIINALLSWIPQARDSKFSDFLKMITEPILTPFRQAMNKLMGERYMMMDFSPLFAIIAIQFLMSLLRPYIR